MKGALVTVLLLLAACALADKCQTADGKYDLTKLTKSPFAGSTIGDNWYDTEVTYISGRNNYTYYINVCSPIFNSPNDHAYVLQAVLNADMTPDLSNSFMLGSSYDLAKPNFPEVGLQSLHDGDLRLVYGPGDPIKPPTNNMTRNTMILFQCQDVGVGTPQFADEDDALDYTFIWASCYACPVDSQIYQNCPAITTLCTSKGLSHGSVLLIVFFSLLAAYIIVGTLFGRFVMGEKGLAQLPHRNWWGELFSNMKAGFSFVFACSYLPRSKPTMSKVSYQTQAMENGLNNEDLDEDPDMLS